MAHAKVQGMPEFQLMKVSRLMSETFARGFALALAFIYWQLNGLWREHECRMPIFALLIPYSWLVWRLPGRRFSVFLRGTEGIHWRQPLLGLPVRSRQLATFRHGVFFAELRINRAPIGKTVCICRSSCRDKYVGKIKTVAPERVMADSGS
ncbi:hypothetical protein [Paraburkholderia sp.]|uniref:hypothetical protein n=1 Tax=Paraburkholderia sp. TaxID=1926495 RepID=UPI0025D0663D|nr:hypothetical protein [Paraburkholderia sp.]